jgi:hypothetical protein
MAHKRKGMSPVIATVAIVLITVAAAAILAGIVVPLVKTQLNNAGECLGYEDYFSFYEDFGYNCYQDNSPNWLYGLSIKAGSEDETEKVGGFKLQFLKGAESISVDVKDGDNVGEVRMLDADLTTLAVPKSGEVRTYVYSAGEMYDSVEVYPLMKSGRMCDKTDSLNLQSARCGASVDLNG